MSRETGPGRVIFRSGLPGVPVRETVQWVSWVSWAEFSCLRLLARELVVVLVTAFLLVGFATAQAPTIGTEGSRASAIESAGREIYGRCLACHAIEYDRVGPRHCGLFGRRAGSVGGVPSSDAMRNSQIVWGRETLDRFLSDPMGVVPGTLMTYAGVPDQRERALLISWLKSSTSPERCQPAGSGSID